MNLLVSFSEILSYAGYVAIAILVLLAMITVHESGHYIAGKIFGFGIEEFAIGFGPRLFQRTKKDGEKFSVRLLPLGGFCAFLGEDQESDNPKAFNNKKPWQRLIVLVSGVLMNYIFAVMIIALMFGIYGDTVLVTYKVEETSNPIYTQENSFTDKDIILKANGKSVYLISDLMSATKGKEKGESVNFTIIREGKERRIDIVLRSDTAYKNMEDTLPIYKALGINYSLDENGEIVDGGLYQTGIKYGFFKTVAHSFVYSVKIASSIFVVFGELISGLLSIKAMGGTITTISVTASAIRVGGFRYLLNIASFIGVNLAVFNILPIPALDGSRAVFTIIEWIRKKPVDRRVEGIIHTIGFVLILAFAVFVDLQQCF